MSASNRSFSSKRTRFSTPALLAFTFASWMRSGLISIPTPWAPYSLSAAITIRPSPQPRSYTMSERLTSASFNIAFTASSVNLGLVGGRFGAKNGPDPRYGHIARFKLLDRLHARQPVVVGRDFRHGLIVRPFSKGGLRFEFHRVPPSYGGDK